MLSSWIKKCVKKIAVLKQTLKIAPAVTPGRGVEGPFTERSRHWSWHRRKQRRCRQWKALSDFGPKFLRISELCQWNQCLSLPKQPSLYFFAYPNLHESSRMRKFTKSTTDRSAQSILVPRLGLGQLFLTKSIKVHDSNEVFRFTNQFKMVERWFLSETDTSELRQTSRFQIQCYLVDFSAISSYLFHLS